MQKTKQLLCVGHDSILNRTRRLILEKCFDVKLAPGIPEAMALLSGQRFDLVLLCYSLTDAECRAAVEFIHSLPLPPKILALAQPRDRLLLHGQDDEFVSGGPAELLAKAAAMAGISLAEECEAGEEAPEPEP